MIAIDMMEIVVYIFYIFCLTKRLGPGNSTVKHIETPVIQILNLIYPLSYRYVIASGMSLRISLSRGENYQLDALTAERDYSHGVFCLPPSL